MKYIVIKNHTSEYPNPIVLQKGERVTFGEDPNPEVNPDTWINWIYCIKEDNSNEGFVPMQIIQKEENYGTILENYTAKELDIKKGIILEGIKELNGWLWAKNDDNDETGWIPLENVQEQTNEG